MLSSEPSHSLYRENWFEVSFVCNAGNLSSVLPTHFQSTDVCSHSCVRLEEYFHCGSWTCVVVVRTSPRIVLEHKLGSPMGEVGDVYVLLTEMAKRMMSLTPL